MDRQRVVIASVAAMLALVGLAGAQSEVVSESGTALASLAGKARDQVVASAESGLDLHWNAGYTDYYLYLSYIGTDDTVHVFRKRTGSWEDIPIGFHTLFDPDTSVTAYGDTVMVAYAYPYSEGNGVRYLISYNGGDDWWIGVLAQPDAGEGIYPDFDITARGGGGTAAVFDHEEGAFDPVYFRLRPGYGSGSWDGRVVLSDHDVVSGTPLAVEWLGDHTGYGLVYITDLADRLPYFASINPFPFFADGFESGDTSAWSSSGKGFSTLLSSGLSCPDRTRGELVRAGDEFGAPTSGLEGLTAEPRGPSRPSLVLRSLPPGQSATLEVELGPTVDGDCLTTADDIEGMWRRGQRELAAAALEELEGRCPGVAVGIDVSPQTGAKSRLADSRIGGARTGARSADLGYDPATGNLFASFFGPTCGHSTSPPTTAGPGPRHTCGEAARPWST